MISRPTYRQSSTDLRWVLTAAVLTALQAAVIFLMSDRSPATATAYAPVPKVRLAAWDITVGLADPRLLALPTEEGFAGIGWRAAMDPPYVVQDWTEPMPWLGQSETGLARTLLAAPTVGIGRGVTADKPAPQFASYTLPPLPLSPGTVVRLEGEGWELTEPLVAPSITHSNILSETVVQVIAERSGQVFSVVVLKSSGLRTADNQALALTRTARFRISSSSEDAGEWAWGRVIFEWRTVAPSTTGDALPRGS